MPEIKMSLTAREDLIPKCPFCSMEVTELYTKAKGFPLLMGKNIIYFCPHCLKILGIAQGRMG